MVSSRASYDAQRPSLTSYTHVQARQSDVRGIGGASLRGLAAYVKEHDKDVMTSHGAYKGHNMIYLRKSYKSLILNEN